MCQTGVIERDDVPFVLVVPVVLYTGKNHLHVFAPKGKEDNCRARKKIVV